MTGIWTWMRHSPRSPFWCGRNDMITQVIYNLLEKRHQIRPEGTTLYLGVTTIDGKARVTVRNLGDTIPAEELPLLFERFHKSDKSRSEDKDGVGLGLLYRQDDFGTA